MPHEKPSITINPKARLNGYWHSKKDPTVTIYVERVFKAGYITGFKYKAIEGGGQVHSQIKLTHEELSENYQRRTYHA